MCMHVYITKSIMPSHRNAVYRGCPGARTRPTRDFWGVELVRDARSACIVPSLIRLAVLVLYSNSLASLVPRLLDLLYSKRRKAGEVWGRGYSSRTIVQTGGGLGTRLLFIPADMKFNCGMICTYTGNQALFRFCAHRRESLPRLIQVYTYKTQWLEIP